MKRLIFLLCVLLLFGHGMPVNSEEEIEALRRIAEAEAAEEPAEEMPEELTFKAKGLSLQALNPEISVTGDMVAYYREQDGRHMDEPEDRLIFQCIFATGPHKHERY